MSRRLLALWFPRLASDVSLRAAPLEGPFALTSRQGNRELLHCLNIAAESGGLGRGMGLADARAILPELATRPADPQREAAALEALRRWTGRYAPHVAVDGPGDMPDEAADGLIADITGAAHLFGGEEPLRQDLEARIERMGLAIATAIAPTRAGAHALARHGGGLIPPGRTAEYLGALPVAALRISPTVVDSLNRLGLTRIADLIPMPRAPLAKRFGPELVRSLDRMLGTLPEPVAAPPESPHFGVRMALHEPIGLTVDVMAGLERLLAQLCDKLGKNHRGARRLRLELRRVDSATVRLEIGLARAMRDPERIAALFRRHVEAVDAGFGIDALRLEATQTEALLPAQVSPHHDSKSDELADLVSRLGNRLGFEQVLRILPADSLIPERSFLLLPVAHSVAEPVPHHPRPPRPALIFPPEPIHHASGHPPTRFSWRRMRFTTLRAHGPERIAPEWWRDHPEWRSGLRDYWRIETGEGPRLWLFHTPSAPGWYAQGCFA